MPTASSRGHRKQAGQGLVEYAFLFLLIFLVVYFLVVVIGGQTFTMFSTVNSVMPTVGP
jgi:hypothetical protein